MKLLSRILREPKHPVDTVLSQRLEESIENSGYWARRMPREAARLVRKVRLYALAAAVLSLITGLLVWPVIAESSQLTAQVIISVLSGLAALTIFAPHAAGLSDRGDESIKLGSTYGAMHRELLEAKHRLATGSIKDPDQVADIIRQFEHIQKRRDALALPADEGHAGGPFAIGPARDGSRQGWALPAALRGSAQSLLPATEVHPETGEKLAVDDEAVLAALVYVLTSESAPPDAPRYSTASASTMHRPFPFPFPFRSRAGEASSPRDAGRSRRLWTARSLTSGPRLLPRRTGEDGEPIILGPADQEDSRSTTHLLPDAPGGPVVLGVTTDNTRDTTA